MCSKNEPHSNVTATCRYTRLRQDEFIQKVVITAEKKKQKCPSSTHKRKIKAQTASVIKRTNILIDSKSGVFNEPFDIR